MKKTKKEKKLTKNALAKYKKIIDEWFNNDFNGKKAYLKYYKNVKAETASTNFSKLQQYPEIKEYIQEKHEEASKVVKTTHEGILQELVNWVSSDITETIGLTPEEIKQLPVSLRRLITEYKHEQFHTRDKKTGAITNTLEVIKLKFVSKERALEMINKHLGFYEVDNKQKAAVINITTSNDKHKELVESIMNGEV